MDVRVVDPGNIDAAVIAEAARMIRDGEIVAFPTETVYGLGADATNAEAVEKIFTTKGRPSYNPLIVHVADVASARAIVTEWPETAGALAARFWPGPLTLVLPKKSVIPDVVTAGLTTVGVRVPAHPVALALLRAAGRPIAAPSANPSMGLSPTQGRHVSASLGGTRGLILDAGPVPVGIESTVLDLSSSVPTILRPGMLSRTDLAAVVGEIRTTADPRMPGEALPAPGMLDRHYSPRARLVIAVDASAATLQETISRASTGGGLVAALLWSTDAPAGGKIVRMPDEPNAYARVLYATLHQLDDEGFDTVIVQPVPNGDAWDGIRDRLRRAAT